MPLGLGSSELTQQTTQVFVPGGLITRLFFPMTKTTKEKYVDVTTKKGGRKLAPFVSPKLGGVVMKQNGKKLATYEPPLLKPKLVTEADSILEEQSVFFGDGKTPEDRAEDKLIEDETELKRMVYRRKEHMAISLVTTGKFNALGEGVEEEFDYSMNANNIVTLTGTNLWTDAASNPLKNLSTWADDIFKLTGKKPDSTVFGKDVYSAFKLNDAVIKAYDTRRINVGELRPRPMLDAEGKPIPGVTYVGRWEEENLDIYAYNDYYEDEDGVVQAMFPADKLVMGNAMDAGHFDHAGITDKKELPGQVFEGEIFVKSYTTDDPSDEYLLAQSKPLPIPSDIDSFLCAKAV
ncbi:major capsid protein [Sulfurovum sp. zt1-1]|uniref:Major capsid protein n=1 Tax=Sulfurovum zhangzhouensis TaxID=3019067 RepID=A0ABT7QZ17_9BACT|nr:major capsid protein [Sulfurovum zhangzhouensis]MDM5272084.1 major capsid protein [Sulfurovum zhangzhouensis]